jgi:hypothetical protein
MSTAEQNRIILDLIDFKWDINWVKTQFGEIPPNVNYEQNILRVLHDIQAEDGYYFMKRQDINREIRNKLAFIEEIGKVLPEGYNADRWESVNLGDIYKKIETIRNNNEWIEKAKKVVEGRDNKIRGFRATMEIDAAALKNEINGTRASLEKQIIELKNKITEYEKDLSNLESKRLDKMAIIDKTFQANIASLDGEVNQYADLAGQSVASFAHLQLEADSVEKMKSFINEHKRLVELNKNVADLNIETEALTGKIEKARELPGEILSSANIPIDGLTIENGEPLINGLPISNLSEGEKMSLCISVAVQKEGALKLVLIDGIESIATVKRNEIYTKLKAKGVQFLATRTSDEESLTVVEL